MLDQPARQDGGKDRGNLAAHDAPPGELGLGPVIARHFGGQRLERNDLECIDQLEQDIGDEIIIEALPRDPHDREGDSGMAARMKARRLPNRRPAQVSPNRSEI
jgi:hypothetical protein